MGWGGVGVSSNIRYYMTTNGPRSSSRVCASPMRKPYAKALCTRVLLKDIYKGFLNGGAAAGGRRPPVEEGAARGRPPL